MLGGLWSSLTANITCSRDRGHGDEPAYSRSFDVTKQAHFVVSVPDSGRNLAGAKYDVEVTGCRFHLSIRFIRTMKSISRNSDRSKSTWLHLKAFSLFSTRRGTQHTTLPTSLVSDTVEWWWFTHYPPLYIFVGGRRTHLTLVPSSTQGWFHANMVLSTANLTLNNICGNNENNILIIGECKDMQCAWLWRATIKTKEEK